MENIEQILRTFWEKTRRATELINQLRESNQQLILTNQKMEREIQKSISDLTQKELELKRLKQEHAQIQANAGGDIFTISEKEETKNRIRGLIAKINSHLG